MKAVIRSCGACGQAIKDKIEKYLNMQVMYFVEPVKLAKKYDMVCGISVISQYQVVEFYKKQQVQKYIIPGNLKIKSLLELENELIGFGIKKDDIIVIPVELVEKSYWSDVDCEYIKSNHDFRYLQYMEFHVADHCNLNCENCTHFSPLVEGQVFSDLRTVEKDLSLLKQFVDGIGTTRILGGECLLNPELKEYIPIVKMIYPYTELSIVSNGILIRQMNDELVETLLEYDVGVDLSAYPPLFPKMDEITDFLENKGIRYNILGPVFHFSLVADLDHEMQYPFKTTEGQWGCGCYNLYNGKIAICPTVCYSFYHDNFYGKNELIEMAEDGITDLEKIQSFSELISKLQAPCKLCNHCLFYRSKYDKSLQKEWKRWFPNY